MPLFGMRRALAVVLVALSLPLAAAGILPMERSDAASDAPREPATRADGVDREPTTSDAVRGSSTAEERSIRKNVSDLVPSTGYVMVPVHLGTPGDGALSIAMAFHDEGPHPRAAASLVVTPTGFTSSHLTIRPAEYDLAVSTEDRQATCCDLGPRVGPSGPSEIGTSGHMEATEPHWMAIVADGWTEDDWAVLEVTARTESLAFGEPITGERVQAIDLLHEAYDNGTTVRSQDRVVHGEPGPVHRSWQARTAGIVLGQWDLEDGRGDLTVTLPNGTMLSTAPSQQTWGYLDAFTDPGEVTIELTDAERPEWQPPGLGSSEGTPEATVLVLLADLPVDVRQTHLHQHAT